ncbi:hypothetical protein K1719_031340 [Acacia pycnantha]|nr:hypothetical protein K1719_031340 [Acacia pycnantha]
MTSPNPQIADDTLPSQNPNLVENQQCEDQQIAHSDSQSSKTLISDNQDPETLTEQNASNPQAVASESENPRDSLVEVQTGTQNVDDVDATSALSPRNADINVSVSDASSRRGPKRKRMRYKWTAQEKKSREKFQVLVETLKPVPFIPAKTLDFTSHETLLRRLGLWDFVHIEFDRSIRSDLVVQLIASYNPSLRSSYVNGMRIMVNRADLGRALKLPVKKTVVTDDVLETLDLAESISFIEEVVSNWMLLHEDTYIMPTEVLVFTKTIKEGHLEKVDWAGLIWQMVEKELKSPQLVNCYYASHLQQLIKVQREEFLREEPKVEMEVKDEEEEEEEDDCGGGDLKMSGVEDGNGDMKSGGVEDGGPWPAQERKSREKFQVLVETLKPVPFIPAKTLDFTSHETLLRRLGLWDFVHIEFDRSIRSDLVGQLIAGYNPSLRSSYVNGMRIMVNRADLGRALKLPVKKTVVTDDVLETLDLAESISFIEEVMSNWMLLHEDTYIMPTEVLVFTKTIKEGTWRRLIGRD